MQSPNGGGLYSLIDTDISVILYAMDDLINSVRNMVVPKKSGLLRTGTWTYGNTAVHLVACDNVIGGYYKHQFVHFVTDLEDASKSLFWAKRVVKVLVPDHDFTADNPVFCT